MSNAVQIDILRQVRERDIRLVRFLYCDVSSVIRAKATHARELEERLHSGISLTTAAMALSMLDQIAGVEGLSRIGEVRLQPDPTTFVTVPYAARTASMCSDMVTVDGEPWPFCPRTFLRRMVRQLGEKGLRLRASFEGAFTLLPGADENQVPVGDTVYLSTAAMNTAAPLINDLLDAFEAQHLHVQQYCAGAAQRQHELTIRHAEAIAAADNQVTFRETVRGVAGRHGLRASFAPHPRADQPGNRCHLHFSLIDGEGHSTPFYTPHGLQHVATRGRQFIAGVLDHLPALTALTCASTNSYRRLRPEDSSSLYVCWGPDNREAAIRVASPYAGEEAGTCHAELRVCDHSANPYLALGGLIAAGLDGLGRELALSQPLLQDPVSLTDAERTERGINRLPRSLIEALDALTADAVLCEALGPGLSSAIQSVKRCEARAFADHDAAYEMGVHTARL